jgi:hypothetical protein
MKSVPSGELAVRAFVAHSFKPRSGAYVLEDYRTSLELALRAAEESLVQLGTVRNFGWDRVRLSATFESEVYDAPVSEQVVDSIRSSDFAIVDITDTSPNVMYELGYLDACNTPVILIASRKSTTRTPVDVGGRFLVEYDDVEDLLSRIPSLVVRCVESVLKSSRLLPGDRDFAWFPGRVQELHVVASLSPDNLYSADPSHRNFVYLEQFSDKDTLLDLMVLLSRLYTARVHKYTSGDFPRRQLLRSDLVVVGGPGVVGTTDGNPICREMLARINSRVRYAEDGESLTVRMNDGESRRLEPQYSGENLLTRDFGYFARFPNPFAPDSTVVMIHGLHTAGGLGAAHAFSDLPQAAQNFRLVRAALPIDEDSSPAFESVFEVETMMGEVVVPRIDTEYVFSL